MVITDNNGFFNYFFSDLDEFYKFKRSNKLENSSFIFYHLPTMNSFDNPQSQNQTLNSEQARE